MHTLLSKLSLSQNTRKAAEEMFAMHSDDELKQKKLEMLSPCVCLCACMHA